MNPIVGQFRIFTSWYLFPQHVSTCSGYLMKLLINWMCPGWIKVWLLNVVHVKSLFYRSFGKFSSTSKTDEMDPKKKKKFEKEEKEFRKKFKVRYVCLMDGEWMTLCINPHGLLLQYNAEIKVLYPATVLQSLSVKKFGNKDLPVKPGEIIDVIVHPVEDKLIGRNSEGKCELICVVQVHIIQHLY